MNANQLGAYLLTQFGIDPNRVTSAVIRFNVDQPAEITVTCPIFKNGKKIIETISKKYVIKEVE